MAFASLVDLPPRDSDGAFRVVVESPKGSTVKLTYEEQLGTFIVDLTVICGRCHHKPYRHDYEHDRRKMQALFGFGQSCGEPIAEHRN